MCDYLLLAWYAGLHQEDNVSVLLSESANELKSENVQRLWTKEEVQETFLLSILLVAMFYLCIVHYLLGKIIIVFNNSIILVFSKFNAICFRMSTYNPSYQRMDESGL